MKKGFTLLELLIVVVILGILALIAAPALLNAAERAREGAIRANVSAASSTVTSSFALEGADVPTTIAANAIADLNDGGNTKNPIDGSDNAFAAAAAAGIVTIVGDDAAGTVTITGYDRDSAALITKTIQAPEE